jgi:hypothetical protein
VNYMRDYQLGLGLPRNQVYNQTMYVLVGMLVIGLVCNLLIKPVDPKYQMTDAELEEEKRLAHDRAPAKTTRSTTTSDKQGSNMLIVLAWLAVCVPLAWGVYRTLISVVTFFR